MMRRVSSPPDFGQFGCYTQRRCARGPLEHGLQLAACSKVSGAKPQ